MLYKHDKKHVNIHFNKKNLIYTNEKLSECNLSKQLCGLTNELLGNSESSVFPSDIPECELPDRFWSFFEKKIASSRSKFDSRPADDIPTLHSFVGSGRCGCEPLSKGLVRKRICDSAPKICALDSVLTTWLKTYLDDLVPLICRTVNESLLSGLVPLQFKEAVANAPLHPSPRPLTVNPLLRKKRRLQICVSFAVSLQTAREDCPASDSEPFVDQQCL